MKTLTLSGLLASASLAALAVLAQQPADSPSAQTPTPVAMAAATNAPAEIAPKPEATAKAGFAESVVATNAPPENPSATNSLERAANSETNLASVVKIPEYRGDKGLRLNFRSVPLEVVLTYLSSAAGFIIVQETEVKGKVDVWSQQPLSKDEAVDLLNSILNKNGYAAIRNGRTLTIVSRDDAKKRDLPVKTGSDPEGIPKNDEMVTQIISVRYANAVQMIKDLSPLLPSYASMTANESGNALVITDTQADIRRMAQIVKALDTSIAGISSIRVFPLRYADAKEIANEIKELFPSQDSSANNRNNQGRAAQMFGRFGGPGGPFGGQAGAADQGTGQSEARKAAARVVAVADERTNSLIVGAPDDVMPTIELLVKEIDTNAENITELRVFQLKHSDSQEMADLLTSLFPDDSNSDAARSSVQFGRGQRGFGGMNPATATPTSSTRAKQKGKVTAVPDPRTSAVIVSAASELMPQIAEVVAQLDADPAKKQKVFVYSLENADVDSVRQVLQDMFQSQNSRNTSRQNSGNPLTTRQQNQSYGNTGTTSGFGSSSGTGGRTSTRRSN